MCKFSCCKNSCKYFCENKDKKEANKENRNIFNDIELPEIVGRITDVPWAIIFKKVDSYPRHPSQIYEAIGYFTISLCVYSYYRYCNRRPLEGRLLGLTLAGGFAFRSFIEIFKENQASFEENMLILNRMHSF